jgi:large subunit ribosomal protein L4
MMKHDLISFGVEASKGSCELNDAVFSCDYNESLVHQVIVAFQAGQRQGSKSNLSRSEVSGGGKKPWRQKGTGRARAGTIRSPIWRSGGVTFAAKPRDFSQKVNRKMYRKAMCCILSEQQRQGALFVTDTIKLSDHKTKTMVEALKPHQWDGVICVVDNIDETLFLASRNIPKVHVIDVRDINPLLLYHAPRLLMTTGAVKALEEQLS